MQMTKEEATKFFSEFYRNILFKTPEVKRFGDGWSVNHRGYLATYDFDNLTRLVFMAHEKCIRASIHPCTPNLIRIAIHKREGRTGSFMERHPTIEKALEDWGSR